MGEIRIEIYQPVAHYRVFFTFMRQHTYPIPPYSTVVGLLCNSLEEKEKIERLKDGLSLSIFGKHGSYATTLQTYRNLRIKNHIQEYVHAKNRTKHGLPYHVGGTQPVLVDLLFDVELIIYVYHENEELLEELSERIRFPSKALHLGRAEDWIVVKDVKRVETEEGLIESFDYYTWLPKKLMYDRYDIDVVANTYMVSLYYEIINGVRVFTEYVESKLLHGLHTSDMEFILDKETRLPLFFYKREKHAVSKKQRILFE